CSSGVFFFGARPVAARARVPPPGGGGGEGEGPCSKIEGACKKIHMRTLTPSPPLPRERGREQTEFGARADFTPRERHRLHLGLHHHPHPRLHQRPPQRSRAAVAAARALRLNGFHFSGTGSAAAWRGAVASGAEPAAGGAA